MLPQNTECQEAEFPLVSGSYRPSSPAVWPSLQDYYPPWYARNYRKPCEKLSFYITGLSPRSRSSEQQPTSVILILEIAHQMPPENTGYPNKLCCVGYSHSGPHLEEFKHVFFLVAKFHMEPQKRRLKDCFPDPWIKAICFCNCCTPFVVH